MLLFELFPAFVAIVCVFVGVWLFLVERQARAAGIDDSNPVGSRPDVTPEQAAEKPSAGRPSMKA